MADDLNHYLGDHAGTMSGQVVMAGFLRRQIPIFIRRAVTMLPALVLIVVGFSLTTALVLSQVFLMFGIPFALIPLVVFTSNRRVMGTLVNRRVTVIAAVTVTGVIVALNIFLLATG